MTDKGAAGSNVFKLTVKVDLSTKSKVNKNALKELQKIFERDIAHLHEHFQGYHELRTQHLHHVKQEKMRLGFEFCLKNAKELEQLWGATNNDILANALSEYSEKKLLHKDIGLHTEHLCFKCKIERKRYKEGLSYFPEESSESSDEESEDVDQQTSGNADAVDITSSESSQQPGTAQITLGPEGGEAKTSVDTPSQTSSFVDGVSSVQGPSQDTTNVMKLASVFESNMSKSTVTSMEHSTQSGQKQAAQLMVPQQKLSFGAGTVDASSERATQPGTSQHGGDTLAATQTQTNRSHDVDSFVQMLLKTF